MKKLIIQIPYYNEEKVLAITLSHLPKELPGIDKIEWLVIDDGSTDKTAEIAWECGVNYIVRHPINRGLSRAFMTGIEACLKAGADIIVNTDADNQYNGADIGSLIEPILQGNADMVVGTRPISQTKHFSVVKKILQKIGSWVVRLASNTKVEDAPSGFRAFTRNTASRLIVFSEYTYTLETIIQAGKQGLAIVSVPVRTNEDLRPSRLVKSLPRYLMRSVNTILRISITYSPFRFFFFVSLLFFAVGFFFLVEFTWFFLQGMEDTHVPSIVLGSFFVGVGFFLMVMGVLSDLLAIHRRLLEDIRWKLFDLNERISRLEGKEE